MMKSKIVVALVLALLVLAACAVDNGLPENELAESEVTVSRPTKTATVTVRATVGAERPSPTQILPSTPTPAPTVTPALRPSATVTPHASPTRIDPAPPSTPAAPAQAYQLINWTEQEAQTAIAEAYGAVWESKPGDFSYPAAYFYLVAREALLRFPSITTRSEILWKQIQLEPRVNWQFDYYTMEELPRLLENALNLEGLHPDDIEHYLRELGLWLKTFPADNPFGYQKPAMLLHIGGLGSVPGWGNPIRDCVLLLLPEWHDGAYRVIFVHTMTSFHQSHKILPIEDYNGNGVSEVVVVTYGGLSGFPAGCYTELTILEWRESDGSGHFVDLAWNVDGYVTSSHVSQCEDLWHFEKEPGQNIANLIERRQYFVGDGSTGNQDCSPLVRRTTYTWNGDRYAWNGTEIEPVSGSVSPACAVQWAILANENGNEMLTILEDELQDWPAEMNEVWGPASADYFRFRLGLEYEMRGMRAQAVQTLQLVRDEPFAPQYDLVSGLASSYLETRQVEGIVAACTAVNERMKAAADEIPHGDVYYDLDLIKETWGFSDPLWWAYISTYPCDLDRAIGAAVRNLPPGSGQQALSNWLDEIGVAWTAVSPADLNNDGLQDWLAVLRFSRDEPWWHLRAFIQHETGYTPLHILNLHMWGLPASVTHAAFLSPTGPGFWNTVYAGGELVMFSILTHDSTQHVHEYRLNSSFLSNSPITNVWLTETESDLSLLIEREGGRQQFVWSTGTGTFVYVGSEPPSQSERVGQIEAMIFENNSYVEAVTAIQALLARGIVEPRYGNPDEVPPPRVEPYLRYLLGLCYELLGDEQGAVAAYWQLWHDFPDNLHALMARRKLEPVSP